MSAVGAYGFGGLGDVLYGHIAHHRGALGQARGLEFEGGQRIFDGLWDDHIAQVLPLGQPQGATGVNLPGAHRGNRRLDEREGQRGEVQRKGQHRGQDAVVPSQHDVEHHQQQY